MIELLRCQREDGREPFTDMSQLKGMVSHHDREGGEPRADRELTVA